MFKETVQNLTQKTFGITELMEKKQSEESVAVADSAEKSPVASVIPAKVPDAMAAMETPVTDVPEKETPTQTEKETVSKDPKYESQELKKLLSTFIQTDIALTKALLVESKKTNDFLKKEPKESTPAQREISAPVMPSKAEEVPIPASTVPEMPQKFDIPENKGLPGKTPVPTKSNREVVPVEAQPRQGLLDKVYSKSYNTVAKLLGTSPVNEEVRPAGNDTEPEAASTQIDEEILVEAKKTNELLKAAENDRKMADAAADEASAENTPVPTPVVEKDIQKPNPQVEKNSGKPSLVSKLMDTVGSKVKIPGMGMLGHAAKLAGGAAAVAGAGYAGYKAGEWLNENTNIQSNIASGIDTAKGWFGNSDEDKQKEADQKSAQDLYEKRVKEGKLTVKSAEFFEKQGVKVDKSKITGLPPEAAKSNITSEVEKSVNTKDTIAAEKSKASSAPVVLNTTNNNVSGGGSSAPTIISGMNIRNSESTFDRVQMQNYWSRTA